MTWQYHPTSIHHPDSLVRIVADCVRTLQGLVPTFGDDDRFQRSVIRVRLHLLDGMDDRLLLDHFSENRVLAIQPRRRHCGHVELTAIGVRATIGHAEESRSGVVNCRVLVLKVLPVDANGSVPIATDHVPALNEEPFDDPMHIRTCVAHAVDAIDTQLPEVLHRLWSILSK